MKIKVNHFKVDNTTIKTAILDRTNNFLLLPIKQNKICVIFKGIRYVLLSIFFSDNY